MHIPLKYQVSHFSNKEVTVSQSDQSHTKFISFSRYRLPNAQFQSV